MLDKIKQFLESGVSLEITQSGQATQKDVQVATAVLLLEMAGADEDFAPEEVKACFASLESQFNLTDAESLDVLEAAETLRKEKGKIDDFVKQINGAFSEKQRQLILALIWKVVIADEVIEKYEERFAKQLQNRLQLSDVQAEEAKKLALAWRV